MDINELVNLPIHAQMFVRDQGNGKSMLLCVVPTEQIPEVLRSGAFIHGKILIIPDKVFKTKNNISGWLAEDILRDSWDTKAMNEIPIT